MNEKLLELLADKEAYSLGYAAGFDAGMILLVFVMLGAGLCGFLIGRNMG